jgi:hypothetical protein
VPKRALSLYAGMMMLYWGIESQSSSNGDWLTIKGITQKED